MRHDAMMLDQVDLGEMIPQVVVPNREVLLVPHVATTQAAAVLVLQDPRVGAQKATDRYAHHDETMLAHHDETMLDQVGRNAMMLVHHDAMMLVHHDAMIDQVDHDQVVHAPKVTDQLAHHDAMMLVHHDAMIDQVGHDETMLAHHDETMLAHHDVMIDQVGHVRVVHAPKVTDQVASGRVGLVRQMIAPHAEGQRVHVVIPTSLRVPKQPKNVNL
ncbi:hypothetical protein LBMAG13_01280 [Actinomycetes bacterium]|nr:hypothetical protein LBMAG13_01280 [Actinomycetes bacterium]